MRIRTRCGSSTTRGIWSGSRWRTELLRELGTPYRDLEEEGLHLPVMEAVCRYIKPARHDDVVTVRSAMVGPLSAKVKIAYEVVHGARVLATGYTVHAFTGPDGRPKRPPVAVLRALEPFVENEESTPLKVSGSPL